MEPDVIKRALERIEALKQEISKLEDFVSLYQELAPSLGEEAIAALGASSEVSLIKPTPQRQLFEMVRGLLREAGEPITTSVLYEKLTNMGAIVGGQILLGT